MHFSYQRTIMKKTIFVDSRGAGEGKTTTGIYKFLRIAKATEVPTLVVVPSIKLQEQYLKDIPDLISESDLINSDNNLDDNVSHRIITEMTHRSKGALVITHEAFKRTEIPYTIRDNWALVFDEALDPWNLEKIKLEAVKKWQPNFDFKNLFVFENPDSVIEEDDEVFHLIKVNHYDNLMFTDSPQFKRLVSTNNRLYIKWSNYKRLCQEKIEKDGSIHIVSELNVRMFENWAQVTISAAAFEHTFMNHWFEHNGFEIKITEPFIRKTKHIRLHSVNSDTGFKWSNRKRQNQPEILNKYHEYIANNFKQPILVVRNNSEAQRLADETRIGHNAHGLNSYTHYTSVSLETALVLNPIMADFYTKEVDLTPQQQTRAFSSYTFYQILMRTALRLQDNTQTVDIGILDTDTAIELGDFLNWDLKHDQIIRIPVIESPSRGRPRGSKNKTTAMTSTERSRKHREKQKELAKQLSELVK